MNRNQYFFTDGSPSWAVTPPWWLYLPPCPLPPSTLIPPDEFPGCQTLHLRSLFAPAHPSSPPPVPYSRSIIYRPLFTATRARCWGFGFGGGGGVGCVFQANWNIHIHKSLCLCVRATSRFSPPPPHTTALLQLCRDVCLFMILFDEVEPRVASSASLCTSVLCLCFGFLFPLYPCQVMRKARSFWFGSQNKTWRIYYPWTILQAGTHTTNRGGGIFKNCVSHPSPRQYMLYI